MSQTKKDLRSSKMLLKKVIIQMTYYKKLLTPVDNKHSLNNRTVHIYFVKVTPPKK